MSPRAKARSHYQNRRASRQIKKYAHRARQWSRIVTETQLSTGFRGYRSARANRGNPDRTALYSGERDVVGGPFLFLDFSAIAGIGRDRRLRISNFAGLQRNSAKPDLARI